MRTWKVCLLGCVMIASFNSSAAREMKRTLPEPSASPAPLIGSESAPLYIRGEVTSTTRDNASADVAERERRKAQSDEDLVRYTYWLAIGTVCLFVAAGAQVGLFAWQLRLINASSADARTLAQATKTSSDALMRSTEAAIALELPVLRLAPPDLDAIDAPIPEQGAYGSSSNDGPPTRFSVVSEITCRNYGRTAAFPVELRLGWTVAKSLALEPVFRAVVRFSPSEVFRPTQAEPGEADRIHVHRTIEISDEDIERIRRNEAWLWLFGSLLFQDYMGHNRIQHFCWRHANRNAPGDSAFYFFASDGDPPWAYTRGPTSGLPEPPIVLNQEGRHANSEPPEPPPIIGDRLEGLVSHNTFRSRIVRNFRRR